MTVQGELRLELLEGDLSGDLEMDFDREEALDLVGLLDIEGLLDFMVDLDRERETYLTGLLDLAELERGRVGLLDLTE